MIVSFYSLSEFNKALPVLYQTLLSYPPQRIEDFGKAMEFTLGQGYIVSDHWTLDTDALIEIKCKSPEYYDLLYLKWA